MKTFKALYIENGVIKAGEFPVEPESYGTDVEKTVNDYQHALASAKANAVECEDQTLAATLMNGVKEGDVFVLPSGWDYRVEQVLGTVIDLQHEDLKHQTLQTVAKLYRTDEQPEPDESQEEPDWHNLFWQQRKSNLKPLSTFHLEPQMNNSEKCTLTDQELIEKVDKWVTDLTHSGGDKWCLRIPADYNHDPDFLFMEAVRRMNKYASRISELEAEKEKLEDEKHELELELRHIPTQPDLEAFIDRLKKREKELEAENERLREEHRWIPVTERLPEDEDEYVLILTVDDSVSTGPLYQWKDVPVTHWQPIPQPPKEQ